MKEIVLIVLIGLFSVVAYAEDKEKSLGTVEELNAKVDEQRREFNKCPRIKTISKLSHLSEQERDYYDYATNKIINEFNLHIANYKLESFSASIGSLVQHDGTMEMVDILSVKPVTQRAELEKLVKHVFVQLKEIPDQEKCLKYRILFGFNFNK